MHGDCTHSHTKIARMLKWAILRREMWHIAYIILSADVSPVADIRRVSVSLRLCGAPPVGAQPQATVEPSPVTCAMPCKRKLTNFIIPLMWLNHKPMQTNANQCLRILIHCYTGMFHSHCSRALQLPMCTLG